MGYHMVRNWQQQIILNELIVKRGILIQFFVQYGAAQVDGGPKMKNQG
jgi:hypothetical protein